MLSAIVFLPLVGAVLIVLLPGQSARLTKLVAAAFTLVTLALALAVFVGFDLSARGVQFQEKALWIPALKAHYFLGVDGISLPMVVLTALLGFLVVPISWHIDHRVKEYFAWLLVLETGILGVFIALDFFLFFLFWEVELVPMYFLISIWGYPPPQGRREYSAMKFLIYTIFGSAFMLVGILALYFSTGTFDMVELGKMELKEAIIPVQVIFWLLFIAYAIKLPVFPFHTWLPDAHTDAPTAVSVILAGVLLKMGGYAMIRICVTILPQVAQQYAPLLAGFAVVNILYGAAVTLMQTDIKRMIAYSSVSHMGYVLLGITALGEVGLTGAVMQMFTHGTITGLLFALAGLTMEKSHERSIPEMSGLAHRMPFLATTFAIAGLASLGLPSTSGFVSEILVFLGTFPVNGVAAVLGAAGIVLTAGYMLWMLERIFFRQLGPSFEHVEDATWLEKAPLAVLVAVIMLVGIRPSILTDVIQLGVLPIVARFG